MSILMSGDIYKHLRFFVESGFFFCVTPFRWDQKMNLFRFANGYSSKLGETLKWRSHLTGWNFVKCIFFLHQLSLLYGFVRLTDIPTSRESYRQYAEQVLVFVAFSIICAFEIGITVLGRDILLFINQLLGFCQYVQEVYARRNAPIPQWQKDLALFMQSVAPIGVFNAILAGFQLWQHPQKPIYVTSLIPPEHVPAWGGTTLMFAGLFSIFIYGTWMCLVIFVQVIALFVGVSNFLLNEQRPDVLSPYTTNCFREPQRVVHCYRCLECLYNRYNGICRDEATIFFNNFMICFSVTCNFILIRFHKIINLDTLILFIMSSVIMDTCIYSSYMTLGKVNETSKHLLKSWGRSPNITGQNKLLMSKYLKSCKPLRIEMGNFGYYSQLKSIKTIGRLVVYTARFMLMTKKYF